MLTNCEYIRFIEELKRETQINIIIGINAHLQEIKKRRKENSSYVILIDPSQIERKDLEKIQQYTNSKGDISEEIWTDWGKFLKIFIKKEKIHNVD